MIRRIGEAVVELLDREKIPMDQCIGAGVGVPGTVNRKTASGGAKDYQDVVMLTLGTGIVNIVNIFRPQALLLGGGIAAQGEVLLAPVREMVKTGCFGGTHGELPEIRTAELGNRAGMIGSRETEIPTDLHVKK